MDPLGIVKAGLGLVGNVFNGIFGGSSQSSANATNLQIARETNQQNKELFERQLGFTENMWNKSNFYNTPKAQRERWEDAGFNPYFMLSNMESGNAQSATSPTAPTMQGAHVEPVNYMHGLGKGVSDAVGSYFQARQQEEAIESLGLDNKAKMIDLRYRVAEKQVSLINNIADLSHKRNLTQSEKQKLSNLKQEYDRGQTELKYLDDYLSSRNAQSKEQARREKFSADEAYWKSQYEKQISDAFPSMNDAELQNLAASAAASRASADASRAAAGESRARTKTEDVMRQKRVFEQDIHNKLLKGQLKLQSFGLSQAQLEELRKKDILTARGNSFVIRSLDGFVNWLSTSIGFKAGVSAGFSSSKVSK